MDRCRNCNKSISSSGNGFCSDKCEREFKNIKVYDTYNEHGCFNLIAAALADMFTNNKRFENKDKEINMNFVKSKVVSMWADCSDRFTQEKITKHYTRII